MDPSDITTTTPTTTTSGRVVTDRNARTSIFIAFKDATGNWDLGGEVKPICRIAGAPPVPCRVTDTNRVNTKDSILKSSTQQLGTNPTKTRRRRDNDDDVDNDNSTRKTKRQRTGKTIIDLVTSQPSNSIKDSAEAGKQTLSSTRPKPQPKLQPIEASITGPAPTSAVATTTTTTENESSRRRALGYPHKSRGPLGRVAVTTWLANLEIRDGPLKDSAQYTWKRIVDEMLKRTVPAFTHAHWQAAFLDITLEEESGKYETINKLRRSHKIMTSFGREYDVYTVFKRQFRAELGLPQLEDEGENLLDSQPLMATASLGQLLRDGKMPIYIETGQEVTPSLGPQVVQTHANKVYGGNLTGKIAGSDVVVTDASASFESAQRSVDMAEFKNRIIDNHRDGPHEGPINFLDIALGPSAPDDLLPHGQYLFDQTLEAKLASRKAKTKKADGKAVLPWKPSIFGVASTNNAISPTHYDTQGSCTALWATKGEKILFLPAQRDQDKAFKMHSRGAPIEKQPGSQMFAVSLRSQGNTDPNVGLWLQGPGQLHAVLTRGPTMLHGFTFHTAATFAQTIKTLRWQYFGLMWQGERAFPESNEAAYEARLQFLAEVVEEFLLPNSNDHDHDHDHAEAVFSDAQRTDIFEAATDFLREYDEIMALEKRMPGTNQQPDDLRLDGKDAVRFLNALKEFVENFGSLLDPPEL